jgi:hypothetical protein
MRQRCCVSTPGGQRDDGDYFEIVYGNVVWSMKEAPQ